MNVKILWSNWFQCGSVSDRDGAGEDYTRHTVGVGGITSIEEEKEDGLPYSYLLKFEDGSLKRVFNPNQVEYFPAEPKKPEFPKNRVGSHV